MSCTCGLSICAPCTCFDVYCGGAVTGAGAPFCVTAEQPVLGLPGGTCPGSAPALCNLPLTNPNQTYGPGSVCPIPCVDPITSPCSHGAIDMPPCPSATWACPKCSRNGIGSGAGTAASQGANAAGGALNRPSCKTYGNVGSLLSRWGTALTSLLSGKNYTSQNGKLPCNVQAASIAPTSFGFLLVALIVGFILWQLAFSERG